MARKKTKVEVVFDPQKRKEFLTGFRKRKNERRTRAKADLARNLKEERIRIRQEVKDGFKHMKKSFEPLRELTDEDKAVEGGSQQKAYEDDEVQVKIVELTTNDLAAQRNMLGANVAEESEEEDAGEVESEEDDEKQTNRIPGMDFDVNVKRKRKMNAADDDDAATKSKTTKAQAFDGDIKSKKDLDRLMKTKTLKKMKKSKLFKMKERMDNKNNIKKAKRDRNNTIKSVPKHLRKRLKHGAPSDGGQTRYRKGRLMNKKERRKRSGGGGD
ncbi:nucleolar protein 12 [Drosophila grimshawi]|uniref:Nucleolar protein 12 n=1 Tax=Drosophila grimshawi TaxID=7222 RepID=B4IXE1_DROGR|nr:nucleolar protein 12 [Drosophila grimshawi]EDV96378.1 GH15234 [Drosophila grimshawi]